MKIFKRNWLYFLIVIIFTNCNNANDSKTLSTPTSGKEIILCDETFKPIIEDEINVFTSIYEQASIDAKYKDEVNCLNALLKDSSYLAIVTRKLNNEEKKYFESKQLLTKDVLIAYDAIAIIENPANNDTMLSITQLKNIFTGKIKKWDQLNLKDNKSEIKIIFDNPNSSTIRYVLENITDNKPIKNAVSTLTSKEVIDKVAANKNAIGIIGVNWISDRDDTTCLNFIKKIKVVSITKESVATYSNSFKPYQGYIATGQYPLRREVYCVLTEPRSGLCSGFVSFLASERGQRIILKSGILPATQTIRLVEINNN